MPVKHIFKSVFVRILAKNGATKSLLIRNFVIWFDENG